MNISIDREFVLQYLPRRPRAGHKGTFGNLLVVAGSSCYRGAAVLAVGGALRAGAGLVQLCSTEAVCAATAAQLPACILHPAPADAAGALSAEALAGVLGSSYTAVLAGPGLSATQDTAALIHLLLQETSAPLVLDADALNVLAGRLAAGEDAALREKGLLALKEAAVPLIITPHIGEMARLGAISNEEVGKNPAGAALGFAREHGCFVVLKSSESLVATPEGQLFALGAAQNPGLAKGGSGDVLAGIIASLLAQGFPPEIAAAAGIWLHAEAAEKGVAKFGEAGLSPADLPLCLAEVWRDLGR